MKCKKLRLGDERDAILRAKDSINNPSFYKQLGQNIEENIKAGKQALIKKYAKSTAWAENTEKNKPIEVKIIKA